MPKVQRRVLVVGKIHVIEASVASDGSAPALEALRELAVGLFLPDPDRGESDPWPDEIQPTDYSKLLVMMKKFADDGVPTHGRAINDLGDGLWEFKVGSKRFTFYDTNGSGSYEPKLRIPSSSESRYPNSQFWWLPDFDRQLRLGFVFVKTGPTAGAENIENAQRIRTEDLRHDKFKSIEA